MADYENCPSGALHFLLLQSYIVQKTSIFIANGQNCTVPLCINPVTSNHKIHGNNKGNICRQAFNLYMFKNYLTSLKNQP